MIHSDAKSNTREKNYSDCRREFILGVRESEGKEAGIDYMKDGRQDEV